jgi:hypothetical protein
MIVEYIRYKIDPNRNEEFDEAYRRAGALSTFGGDRCVRRAREADRPHRVDSPEWKWRIRKARRTNSAVGPGPYWNDELQTMQYDQLFKSDPLLLGRLTYQGSRGVMAFDHG